MLQRVMPDLMGMKNILVLNDEAHHCYREKPERRDEDDLKGDDKEGGREEQRGRPALDLRPRSRERKLGVTRVIDLSATPFFLRGSGYAEGTLFPWTMSDFSLMDAIECGIVKLPRVPVADNIPGGRHADVPQPLGEHPQGHAEEGARQGRGARSRSSLPTAACRPRSKRSTATTKRPSSLGRGGHRGPPCFIVVCNNTSTRSWSTTTSPASSAERGRHERRSRTAAWRCSATSTSTATRSPPPNTLLIDSEQLESGEALDDNFRSMAADEIERFRREIVERTGRRQQATTSPTRNCCARS
jgi:type III restriction enzyme